MKRLSDMAEGERGVVASLSGESRFLNRAVSIGLTPGCALEIIKNEKNRPLLIFSRDTMIALNRKESDSIEVEEG